VTEIVKLFGLAGTGKTEWIAEKYVEQVSTRGALYEDLLGISFTRAAGQSLKERCERIYRASPHAVRHRSFEHANIRTLHSFCHHYFLKKYFGELEDDVDEEGTATKSFSARAMYYQVRDFLPAQQSENIERAISKLRLFSYDEERFQKIIDEVKAAPPRRQVLDIDRIYNDYVKEKAKRFDYADCLQFAMNSMKLKAHWKFVSLDEAQDFTKLHWEIIKKHIVPNTDVLLIAGDPTQSIHVWAGADPNYFLNEREIKATRIVELTQSHRIPRLHLPVVNALQRQMTDGTDHFQISTLREGGKIDHMNWPLCLEFLRDQADQRLDTLVLSLNSFNLTMIGNDLIEAGVLFVQDKRTDFSPWSPTVTKSDWYAYSLYYHIWNKNYAVEIPYGKIWAMLESAPQLMDIWRLFADERDKDKMGFTITVADLMDILQIRHDLSEYELVETLFEWPPRGRAILKTGSVSKKGKDREKQLDKAHYRILRYMESCGEGPYVEPCVKLSTVHGAKGLEADTVVVIMSRDEARSPDDQRKLLVNAICRSKMRVVMTWLANEEEQDRHPLKDKNLALIMTHEELGLHLDARWMEEEKVE
jgi:superfamily I DNA/RNA helicase